MQMTISTVCAAKWRVTRQFTKVAASPQKRLIQDLNTGSKTRREGIAGVCISVSKAIPISAKMESDCANLSLPRFASISTSLSLMGSMGCGVITNDNGDCSGRAA